jgi:hypothetical protein
MHGSYGDMIAMLDQYLDGREVLTPEMFYYENINTAYGINRLDPVYSDAGNGLSVSGLLSVFPNPASAQLHISSSEQAFDRLRIMDMQGRMVFQHRERTRELKLDVSEWMAGIYLLESTLDRIRTFQKIVIN